MFQFSFYLCRPVLGERKLYY